MTASSARDALEEVPGQTAREQFEARLGRAGKPAVCVIVPTRNEKANVVPLVERLEAALVEHDAEILFVDDSDDGTPETVRAVARASRVSVRLLHRTPTERTGGLGGAVLAGLGATEATWVVVMDGDLQHPPEVVPRLLAAGSVQNLDVVVASRYRDNGDASGLSSRYRQIVSIGAAAAAKMTFPRRLACVTDPMSGFFALRTERLDPQALRPNGFKILLEILARSTQLRVGEVTFSFAARNAGESKATWREAVRYLRQLLGLRLGMPAAGQRLVRFALVGMSGFLVNLAVLHLLLLLPLDWRGLLRDSASATAATQLAILWNFMLTELWVFAGQHGAGTWRARLLVFWLLGSASLVVQLPLSAAVQAVTIVTYVQATAIALGVLVVLRFLVLDRFLYRGRPLVRRFTAAAAPSGT